MNLDIDVYMSIKKGEQSDKQIDCGIRCLLWLIFVEKYGIKESSLRQI